MASSAIRDAGLSDERNIQLMSKGYPPGPPKHIAKKLNLRDINTYQKLHEEFGDIYMLPLGEVPLVVTRDPVQIRELLGGSATERFPRPPNVIANVKILFGRAQIALDGAEHQANKRMLSQWLFAEPHNAMMVEPLSEIVMDMMERIKIDASSTGKIEAYSIAELAAADVSAALSMGHSYGALKSGECRQLEALKICDRIFLNRAMNKKWRETEAKEVTEQFESNKKIIADTFMAALNDIKSGVQVDHNILAHMVEANLSNRSSECPAGKAPTELEAVSNMIGFLAGVGNTARMLTIAIEMMSRHPEVERKVLEELHVVLGEKSDKEAARDAEMGLAVPGSMNRNMYTYEKLMRLQYLKCVMMECLRLYTPSTSVAPRHCTEPSPLGNFTIPAGTNVMANIYGAHRHPKYWDRTLDFDPMRFNEAGPGEPVRARGFAKEGFFPFSIGGHSCIGRNIAQEFAIMLWACMISNYKVFKAPDQPFAEFNTLKSDQILGFIEAINGCHVSLEERPRKPALETAANERLDKAAPRDKATLLQAVERLKAQQSRENAAEKVVTKDRLITMEEVSQHTTKETGVWFVIHGKVYDVTKWLRDHPGGGDVLLRSAGRDVTKLFEITKHSTFAIQEAEKYRIGVVVQGPKL